MKITSYLIAISLCVAASSCTPFRGCTERTADNFDLNAEEDDGTCIPSRDKMIGDYTYYRFFTDVIFMDDSVDAGTIQLTEANTANNDFNMNLNGNLVLQGSVSGYDITMEQHTYTETYFGVPFNRTYSGTGTWVAPDSVDFTFQMVTQVPMWDGNSPPQVVTVPQTFNYYCTKVQ